MGAARGVLVGGLALTVLYNVTHAKGNTLTVAAGLPGRFAHYLVSPDVPLVPDLSGGPANPPNTVTNPQGDQVYTDPSNGQQYLGGQGGIPILPNAYVAPAPASAGAGGTSGALAALSGIQQA